MKVGILSMQRILNYGSFLQALSLKIQFEKRGHSVYFIDIEPGRTITPFKQGYGDISKKIDKYFFKRIENYFFTKKMASIHKSDICSYLDINKKLPEEELFDLAVIGSDEVFNATIPSPWGFTTQLFGRVKNARTIVTYAASCGSTTTKKVQELHIDNEIKQYLQSVKCISVRDHNTYEFVKSLVGYESDINVDPVFLSNFDRFIPKIKIHKPFMLIYAYGNRINDESEIYSIKRYAKNHGLEILCVGMQQRWCKHNITANAFELLAYIKQAQCIVTDTFHGTVFSIKYNKQFIAFLRDSNIQKLGDLLNLFNLSNRAIKDLSSFDKILNTEIDYCKVNNTILAEQVKSEKYIDYVCKLAEE